jgi:hypothetical protein
MSTQASRTRRWLLLLRLASASLIGLFLLFRVVRGFGIVSIPNPKSDYGWRDALCLAAVVVPLLFVFVGIARSRVAEIIGWSLLLVLVFMAIIGSAPS